VAIVLFTFTGTRGLQDFGPFGLNLVNSALCTGIMVLTVQRLGLLSLVFLFLVMFFLSQASVTLDTSRWFFADSLLPVAVVAGLACYGFYASRGGEPLFGKAILD
jgi:hypothetical protein